MEVSIWWTYVIACIAIIVSPDPSVTYIMNEVELDEGI